MLFELHLKSNGIGSDLETSRRQLRFSNHNNLKFVSECSDQEPLALGPVEKGVTIDGLLATIEP
jgi:hypothetical protein